MSPKLGTKAKTIDDYLAALSVNQRAALQTLRRAIRAAMPDAEECISYGVPSFRLHGRFLVAFGAAAKHCSFYPGAYPIEAHKNELKGFGLSKGTIRFSPDKPLPAALVRKLVKARIAEYAGRGKPPKKRPSTAAAKRTATRRR